MNTTSDDLIVMGSATANLPGMRQTNAAARKTCTLLGRLKTRDTINATKAFSMWHNKSACLSERQALG